MMGKLSKWHFDFLDNQVAFALSMSICLHKIVLMFTEIFPKADTAACMTK